MSGYRLADSLWNKFVRSPFGQLVDEFPEGWLAGSIVLFIVTLPLAIVGGVFAWPAGVVIPLIVITVANPSAVALIIGFEFIRETQDLKTGRRR